MNITLDQQIEAANRAAVVCSFHGGPEIGLETVVALESAADTLRNTAMRQIEDAPKDGTEIDIWIEGYKGESVRIPDCRWFQVHGESGWYRHDRDFYQDHGDSWQEIEDRIIGWMPIPVFPTGEQENPNA